MTTTYSVSREGLTFSNTDTTTLNGVFKTIATAPVDDYIVNITQNIDLIFDLLAINLPSGSTLTIEGNGHTIDGESSERGLFVYAGTVDINNLAINSTVAQGGNGGPGGGGGAGLGGGLFVGANVAGDAGNVTLTNVTFAHDKAVGGAGGAPDLDDDRLGGGGGLGGNGGSDTAETLGAGGGGGIGGGGGAGDTLGVNGGAGLVPGASAAGRGGFSGGSGGLSGGGGGGGGTQGGSVGGGPASNFGGGGGGGGVGGGATPTTFRALADEATGPGGNGGYGGGGGGGGITGGNGGFGGGGGEGRGLAGFLSGQDGIGGNGGFGGGGGFGLHISTGGPGGGGFGAGDGVDLIGPINNTSGGAAVITGAQGGGGGLAAGGDIFVQHGASLTIAGTASIGAGTVTPGAGGANLVQQTIAAGGNTNVTLATNVNPGQAFANGIYLQGNNTLTFSPPGTQTVAGVIGDDAGSAFIAGYNGAPGYTVGQTSVVVDGTGTLLLQAANTYTGNTTIKSGTLELGTGGFAGLFNSIVFNGLSATLQIDGHNMPPNAISGLANGDVIDLRNLTFVAGATAHLGGNTLTVTSGGVTNTLVMSNIAATGFIANPDGFGGTEVDAGVPPTLAGTDDATFVEGTGTVTLSPSVTVTATGTTNVAGATVAITAGKFAGDGDLLAATTANTAIAASYDSTNEILVLTGLDTVAHYEQVLDSVTFDTPSRNPTDFGSDLTRTVTWVVNDGGASNSLSNTATTTIDISTINTPPALTNVPATITFTEGQSLTLAGSALVVDPDSVNLAGATVRITGGTFAGDGDLLAVTTAGTSITASYNSSTETLTLSGADTKQHYQQVLDSVTFAAGDNPDDFGSAPTRTVTWLLDDGSTSNNLSTVQTTTIGITPVNDPPTLTGTTNDAFAENGASITLSPSVTASDPDNLGLVGATVAITGGTFAGDADTVSASIAALFGTHITSSYNAATETLTLTGSDTFAHYAQVLDSVTFVTASDNPDDFGSAPTRTIAWTLDDGSASSPTSTVSTTVTITAVNDAPTLSGVAATATFTEKGAAVTLSGAASIADVDNLNLASATVAITGGTFAGDGDQLIFNVGGTSIVGIYNGGTETLTLSGSDPLANYRQVLDALTFNSTSLNPTNYGSNTTRTVTWVLNDGSGSNSLSATQTETVSLTAVNDAPTVASVTGVTTFTENGAAVTASPTLSVSDPDSLTLVNATVSVGNGFAGDGDVLGFNTAGTSITGSYNAATETLVFSGIDTAAHYQSVLDSVTFVTPSDNPTNYGSSLSRVLTWTVNDGSASSNLSAAQFTTVVVTAVNDAPTLTGVPAVEVFHLGRTLTLAASAALSDPDNLTLANATVRVTAGTFAGDGDALGATTTGTSILASYNAATETLTLTGSDTLAHYSQVLDSVIFTSGTDPSNSGLNPTRTLSWTVNDGAGSNNIATATASLSISTLKNDFNSDSKSDIIFQDTGTAPIISGRNHMGGDASSGAPLIDFMSNGTVASSATLPSPTIAWRIVGSGDFNNDSKSDILWQNTDGTPMIWTMNGPTVTSQTTLSDPGASWRAVGTGDFNGDNKSDILFQNSDGTPLIWTMNGTSVTASATLSDPGASWRAVGTGDFNNDGKSDLVFQNSDGTPMIWLMNGTSVTTSATLSDPGAAWRLIGTGDFNNDGVSDLLFQNNDGTPMIWTMNGTSVAATTTLPNPGAAFRAVGTGDYNGDGKSDILFQSAVDGTPLVWTMNGTTITAQNTLAAPPNPGANWHANSG